MGKSEKLCKYCKWWNSIGKGLYSSPIYWAECDCKKTTYISSILNSRRPKFAESYGCIFWEKKEDGKE